MFDFFDFFQNFCLPLSINLSLKTSLKPLFAGFSYAFDFGPISPFDFPKIFMRLPPRCIGNTCRLFDRPSQPQICVLRRFTSTLHNPVRKRAFLPMIENVIPSRYRVFFKAFFHCILYTFLNIFPPTAFLS